MLFGESEYFERLDRLRSVMAERGVEIVIADEAEMLHYFSGFAISENLYRAIIIPIKGTPTMVVRRLDEQPFLRAAWFDQRRVFEDMDDPVRLVAEVIKDFGTDIVGLDMNSYCMPVKRFHHLKAFLPKVEFVDFSDVFRTLRLIKSSHEVEVMQIAARIADATMQRTIAGAVPGSSSRDAAAIASAAFIELGADFGRSGPITVGRGWNFLHGKLSNEALVEGDVLHLELVPKVSGYCARLMRPAVMGSPSNELTENAAKLIELQNAQIEAMVPGAIASDVDAILRQGAIEAGLRDDYVNNTGYTLGYYFEQAPRTSDFTRLFTPDAHWQLKAGMTFHMYTSSSAGIAFSETVLVTEKGPERLTQTERKLFRCGEPA